MKAVAVSTLKELTGFFVSNNPRYHEQGVATVKGELLRAEPVTGCIASVDVRCPGFDAAGKEIWAETSHCILALGSDGEVRVRFGATKGE